MKRLFAVIGAAALVPVMSNPAVAGGGGCHGDPTPDARGVAVAMEDICLNPLVLRVNPGQTVTWTNKDETVHNVFGSARRWGGFDDVRPSKTVSFTFNKSGVFPYACTLHPAMIGAVVVGDGVAARGQAADGGVVQALAPASSSPVAPTATAVAKPTPTSSQAAVLPSSTEAAVAPVAAPPKDGPPRVDTVAAANRQPDNGKALGGFALVGALLLGGVVFAARRSPATRELIG